MPNYDRMCLSCDHRFESLERTTDWSLHCPVCGHDTERVWTTRTPAVIPDTFQNPLVDDVMTKETQVFYSRSEHRAAMKAHGLRNDVRHVDGDKYIKSMSAISPTTLKAMEAKMREMYPDTQVIAEAPCPTTD